MPLKAYTYKNCGTCRKATKWLDAQGIAHTEIPIRETPPTVPELNRMLAAYDGEIRRLFNTSGGDYKELGLKDTLDGMSKDEALALLATNGNLVKRPFALGEQVALVGFNESAWEAALLRRD